MTIEEFRRMKDNFFRSPDSPLGPEQQSTFTGLKYFAENPKWRLERQLDTNVPKDFVMMQTSTGSQRRYIRAGKISIVDNDPTAVLTVYTDDHGWFLPFRDATAGAESYAAGRYLEPRDLGNGKLLVDFNFAYNPYCAYNERFSCPIPPRENWTSVRIDAGEQQYHD